MSNSSGSALNISFQSDNKDDSQMPKINDHILQVPKADRQNKYVYAKIIKCDTNYQKANPTLDSPYVVKRLLYVNKKWVDLIDFLINSTSFLAIKLKIIVLAFTNGCRMISIIKNEEYARAMSIIWCVNGLLNR